LTEFFIGKTVLASKIIESCKQRPETTTAYFYCRQSDDERRDYLSICRGLLAQLVTAQRELLSYFLEKRNTSGTVTLASQALAEQLLATLLEVDTTFYIVVDGLDECEPAQVQLFMAYLCKLVSECDEHQPGKLRFLLVSQNVRDVKGNLPRDATTLLELKHSDNKDDIELYVRHWARKIQRDHQLTIQQFGDLILNTCGRSKGVAATVELILRTNVS
jgi:hypothetical protein